MPVFFTQSNVCLNIKSYSILKFPNINILKIVLFVLPYLLTTLIILRHIDNLCWHFCVQPELKK